MASIKTGKWKRRLAKANRANPEMSPPPPPQQTFADAAAGQKINRGASDAVPLSPEGQAQAQAIGARAAAKGGFDSVVTDTAARTQQTADEIAKESPKPTPVKVDPRLGAWAQGNLEGRPKKDVGWYIDRLVRQNPSHVIAGQGAMASRPGESFDQFRLRVLPAILAEMHSLMRDPNQRIAIVDHSSSGRLVRAWLAAGAGDDFKIKASAFQGENPGAGTAERLAPDADGEWKLEPADLKAPGPLPPGIYLVHHALTPQNERNYADANKRSDSVAQIGKHVKSGDWGRVQSTARAALANGSTNQQISDAVDAALPAPEDAARLPLHKLMAVYHAASAAKRPQYAGVVAQKAAEAAKARPESRALVARHMRLAGLAK